MAKMQEAEAAARAVPSATSSLWDAPAGRRRESLAAEIVERVGFLVILGGLLLMTGGVMVVAGYWTVSGTADVAEQLARFSSASIGGLAVMGAGGTLILYHQYREMTRTVEDLREELRDVAGRLGRAPDENGRAPADR